MDDGAKLSVSSTSQLEPQTAILKSWRKIILSYLVALAPSIAILVLSLTFKHIERSRFISITLAVLINMSSMQIPANSVWSSMNYTPPRGSCNHKNGMISNKCPCLRFMLHPVKVGHSSHCSPPSLCSIHFSSFIPTHGVPHRPLPHSSATAAATMLPTTTWTIPPKTPF